MEDSVTTSFLFAAFPFVEILSSKSPIPKKDKKKSLI